MLNNMNFRTNAEAKPVCHGHDRQDNNSPVTLLVFLPRAGEWLFGYQCSLLCALSLMNQPNPECCAQNIACILCASCGRV